MNGQIVRAADVTLLDTQPHRVELDRLSRFGTRSLLFFACTVVAWLVFATIDGAVVAPGQFVVSVENKKIQHPTGGVVEKLLVHEGSKVQAGDLLIKLDETLLKSNLLGTSQQVDELLIRRARLEAERDKAPTIGFPVELVARRNEAEIQRIWQAENTTFTTGRTTLQNKKDTLAERIGQFREEIKGYEALMVARDNQAGLIAGELEGVRDLYAKKLVPLSRVNALLRDAQNIEGQRGQLISSIAQSNGKISEAEMQIQQADDVARSQTLQDLREAQVRLYELSEKAIGLKDQLERMEIRAPVSGTVQQLQVHTIGGVVSPAEPVMIVVPDREVLSFDARVPPQDVDQLAVGQPVRVKIHAFNARVTPELKGTVERISADVIKEQQQNGANTQPFYTVRVTISDTEFERLEDKRVIPGMQGEAFIKTSERTPLEYLIKPLRDQMGHAMRER